MAISYEVGAIFRIQNEASSVLTQIADQLKVVDSLAVKAKEALTALASTRFGGLTERMGLVGKELDGISNRAARTSNEMVAGFGRATASIEKAAGGVGTALTGTLAKITESTDASVVSLQRAQEQIARVAAEMRAAAQSVPAIRLPRSGTAGGGAGALPPGGGSPSPGSASGGTGGGGGAGGARPGGGGGGGGRRGAMGHGTHRWHHLDIGGDAFMSILAAGMALHGAEHVFQAGAELEHFKAQAAAAGISPENINRAVEASWANIAKNPNASVTEGMRNILELSQATGSIDDAINLLPVFTRTDNALSSIKDEGMKSKVGSKKQSYNFARSLELLGVTTDPEKLDAYAAAMTREMIGMRGLVDGNTFMQGVQNAGGARYGWNQDFVSHVLGPLLQESQRNATGLYQLDRSFGQGVMTQMMSAGAEKYGLYSHDDESWIDGKFKGMKVGSIAGYEQMRANPEAWALNTVLPLMKKQGVDVNDTNQMAQAINEISRGNKNLNVVLDSLLLPQMRALLAKERENIDRVPADASGVLQKSDPDLAVKAFTTSWHNLMVALGDPMVAPAANALQAMASVFNSLALTAKAHPDAVKIIGEIAVGLAGALTVLGSAAIVTALAAFVPGGVAIVGITSLVAVLGSLAAFNWSTITGIGDKLKDALTGIGPKLTATMDDLAKRLGDAIASIPGKVGGAISQMASELAAKIGHAILNATPDGGKPFGSNGPQFTPNSYHPPGANQRPIHLQSALYVDGKRMAAVVTKHQIAAHEHPRQAPYADAAMAYTPLDYGFSTG